jgi:hypothetical protein
MMRRATFGFLYVTGVTTALGALPAYYFINTSRYGPHYLLLYTSCLIGGLLASVTPPNVRAILLNVNPPETRGRVFHSSTSRLNLSRFVFKRHIPQNVLASS